MNDRPKSGVYKIKQQKMSISSIQNNTDNSDSNKKPAKTKNEFEQTLSNQVIFNGREIHYNLIKNIAKKVFGWRMTRYKPDKETGSTAL